MRRGSWPRLWPLLGVLCLLTYNTWALWSPMRSSAEVFNGYLSELSASNQPHNLFFRAGDLTTSLIVGALGGYALLVLRGARSDSWGFRLSSPSLRWWRLAAAGLLLFAVSTFLDSFFSLDCSPTLSEACRIAEESGQLSAIHYAHTYTSVGAETGIVTSMVAAAVAIRRGRVGDRLVRRAVLLLAAGEVAALTVMMAMLAAGARGIGYPQVVMVVLASVWFAGVGVFLASGRPATPATPSPGRQDSRVG